LKSTQQSERRILNSGAIAKNDELNDQMALGVEIEGEQQRIRLAALVRATSIASKHAKRGNGQ
jgi:hypothetical protein